MKLTSENVKNVFMDCLFEDGEDTNDFIKADGLIQTIGFNPQRVKKHKKDIENMLSYLPEKFKDGWSFLNMCNDKYGKQWTGLHQIMEQLVQLGIAIKKVEYCMPREMWKLMPGGMPYIIIKEAK